MNSLTMVVTAIMSMVVTATGTVTGTAMAETIDPRATAAPVVLAAATVAGDTAALAVDITVAKVARVDAAVIMVARVARVAKEGIIEEETMVAASPTTTVEAVPLPSTLPLIRTAVTMAVVAVVTDMDTDTARRTAMVAVVVAVEEITIVVMERLMAMARGGFTTLFNFFILSSRVP